MSNIFNKKNKSDPIEESTYFRRRFLRVFVPLALSIVLITLTFLLAQVESERRVLQNTERNLVGLVSQSIVNDLQIINSDLFYLANLPQFIKFLDSGERPSTELVENFKLFSKHKKVYDQIRYLDVHGMEIIRVNHDGLSASVVPPDKLQSKARRYYFEDSLSLSRDEVFVSPFDLNMEHGKVEIALKPMIRFGTPVFDSKGDKRGIILLNYNGKEIFSTLEKYSNQSKSTLTMINSDGYWLKGIDPVDEWGFMFAEKRDATIFKQFPAIKNLFNRSKGQILNDDGLLTYSTVTPLTTNQTSSDGSSSVYGSSSTQVESKEYGWTIISYVNPEMVQDMLYHTLDVIIAVFCALIIFAIIFCRLLANHSMQKEKTAALVRTMAYHDELTDLPNRRLMDDRLQQTIAIADRSRCSVAVMFLDLDHFKPVNDTFGHEVGDRVLKMVSERLSAGVRAYDTVSRIGGDEFVMILGDVSNPEKVHGLADKINKIISAPYLIDDLEIIIGTSIGIAVYPDDTSNMEELVQLADQALYGAKNRGRNCSLRYADLETATKSPETNRDMSISPVCGHRPFTAAN